MYVYYTFLMISFSDNVYITILNYDHFYSSKFIAGHIILIIHFCYIFHYTSSKQNNVCIFVAFMHLYTHRLKWFDFRLTSNK